MPGGMAGEQLTQLPMLSNLYIYLSIGRASIDGA